MSVSMHGWDNSFSWKSFKGLPWAIHHLNIKGAWNTPYLMFNRIDHIASCTTELQDHLGVVQSKPSMVEYANIDIASRRRRDAILTPLFLCQQFPSVCPPPSPGVLCDAVWVSVHHASQNLWQGCPAAAFHNHLMVLQGGNWALAGHTTAFLRKITLQSTRRCRAEQYLEL